MGSKVRVLPGSRVAFRTRAGPWVVLTGPVHPGAAAPTKAEAKARPPACVLTAYRPAVGAPPGCRDAARDAAGEVALT